MKSKYLTTFTTTIILSALSHSPLLAQSNEGLTSKLITMTFSAGYDRDDENLKGLMFFNSSPEAKLSYLVKTNNIVQLLDNTLTINGKAGSKKWKCGFFPKINDDANAILFTVEHQGDLTGKQKEMKLKGTVDIQTGTKLIKKDFAINEFNKPINIGKLKVSMKKNSLKVVGKHSSIKKIKVHLKGKEIKSSSSSWSGNSKTFDFQGIGKGAKISLSYWAGLETKTVSFSY